jgi:membrane-associated phospholipid phosphatase
VRHSEWLVFGYFVWLVGAGALRRLPTARRWQLIVGGSLMCAITVVFARVAPPLVRDWAPGPYILVGYYLSGRLFATPSLGMERWLAAWDVRLLGNPATRFQGWPRWLLFYLEVVYLGCFLVVPAGLAVLLWTGHASLANRFWTMVVAAEFGAFAPLALVQTRPPWALESGVRLRDDGVHRIATRFVKEGTIGANTFPSGHVAGSLAVAFGVIGTLPWVGLCLLVVALSISLACVVGRYHYAVDVAAGAVMALGIWAVVAASGI